MIGVNEGLMIGAALIAAGLFGKKFILKMAKDAKETKKEINEIMSEDEEEDKSL